MILLLFQLVILNYPSSGCSTASISEWTSFISVFNCYKMTDSMVFVQNNLSQYEHRTKITNYKTQQYEHEIKLQIKM